MFLLVAEDRHIERELRRAIESAVARGSQAVVLTADALLGMRLRRDGIDARMTVDGLTGKQVVDDRDAIALDGVAAAFEIDGRDRAAALGTSFGPYLQYTLIPAFVRAVRNITAVDDVLMAAEASVAGAGEVPRVVLVGGGPLVDAARLVAG